MLQLIRHVPSCNCRPYWVLTKCVKETIFAPGSTYLENCRQKVSRVEVNFWWAFTPQGPSTGGTNGGVQAHHLFHPQPVRSLFFHLLIDIAWIRWRRKGKTWLLAWSDCQSFATNLTNKLPDRVTNGHHPPSTRSVVQHLLDNCTLKSPQRKTAKIKWFVCSWMVGRICKYKVWTKKLQLLYINWTLIM